MTLGDGEVLRADVIVGADGIHSVARTEVLGGEPLIAKRSGHSAYRTLVSRLLPLSAPKLTFPVARFLARSSWTTSSL